MTFIVFFNEKEKNNYSVVDFYLLLPCFLMYLPQSHKHCLPPGGAVITSIPSEECTIIYFVL